MGLPHERVLRPRFYVALALTLPVLVLAMGPMLFASLAHALDPRLSAWLQLALTTPVFFWSRRANGVCAPTGARQRRQADPC